MTSTDAPAERDDAWLRSADEAILRNDPRTAGLTLTSVVCPQCSRTVPVEVRSWGELTLSDMISSALAVARSACPAHASPILVGANVLNWLGTGALVLSMPDSLTPEQVEQFATHFDALMAEGRPHGPWLPAAVNLPQQTIVLRLDWTEDGAARSETFGPWTTAAGDGAAHLKQAHDFIGEWSRLTGLTPDEATVHLALNPGQWIAEHETPSATA